MNDKKNNKNKNKNKGTYSKNGKKIGRPQYSQTAHKKMPPNRKRSRKQLEDNDNDNHNHNNLASLASDVGSSPNERDQDSEDDNKAGLLSDGLEPKKKKRKLTKTYVSRRNNKNKNDDDDDDDVTPKRTTRGKKRKRRSSKEEVDYDADQDNDDQDDDQDQDDDEDQDDEEESKKPQKLSKSGKCLHRLETKYPDIHTVLIDSLYLLGICLHTVPVVPLYIYIYNEFLLVY